eukprot:c8057_g1_i1.p1 GENE.c8057_g1_i1~~c8057_g1_i1.p1  ORF type:complete len:281 (+),score=55.31 c8057_g1_i1:1-843(+)
MGSTLSRSQLMSRAELRKELSVVVPTYEEAMNIDELCKRVFKAVTKEGITAELVIVDDFSGKGTEDTVKVVKQLQDQKYDIRIIVRRPEQGRGLSSAVVLGLDEAKFDTMLVMDADLQHEPESVPAIAAPIFDKRADFSLGSRNTEGGKVQDWPLHRKIISGGATALALPLANCSDPMSGFFSIDKATYKKGRKGLNPMGYKIGLELMVRCRCKKIMEVPITFRDRAKGESKLTMKQNILYLRHLLHLYWFRYPALLLVVFLAILITIFLVVRIVTQLIL